MLLVALEAELGIGRFHRVLQRLQARAHAAGSRRLNQILEHALELPALHLSKYAEENEQRMTRTDWQHRETIAALKSRNPLSRGRVVDGEVECGYHGARFTGSGACTLIPAQETIPSRFGATCYRVEERHRLVWLWGGEADRADPSLIPGAWSINDEPGWRPVFGYHHVRGHDQLVLDNILELTHVAYVHKTSLNSPQVTQAPLQVEVEDDSIRTLRITRGADCPPLFKRARPDLPDRIDRWQKSQFFMPSLLLGDMRR